MKNIIIKAWTGPAYAEIKRINDSLSDPRDPRNQMLLSHTQETAYIHAIAAIKRGDDERARGLLEAAFAKVVVEHP